MSENKRVEAGAPELSASGAQTREEEVRSGDFFWCEEHQAFHYARRDRYAPDHRTKIPIQIIKRYYPKLVAWVDP